MPAPRHSAIYGGIPDRPPGNLDGQLLSFAEDLRSEGVAIGTSEILDAFAALALVEWTSQADFKQALATTLAKSNDDRRIFDLVFERFFFRATEAQAARRKITEADMGGDAPSDINLDTLRQQIAAALRDGSDAALRDLARLAIAAFGRGEGSGVLGVDVQRIRRALGLRTEPQPDLPSDDPRREGLPRDQLRRFEQHLRRELERNLIERTSSLPPSARSTSSTGPSRAARSRISRPSTGWWRSSSDGWPPRATSSRAASATPTSTSAGRCARRFRPAASRSSSNTAR